MTRRPKRASTKDVAKLAGVSLGSVSRVINGFDNVLPETRRKVELAMEALDYEVNHAARALRSRTTHTVGCLLTDITNPLYAKLFRVFESTFREAGYTVLLATSQNDPERELNILSMFRQRNLDGALLAPGNERQANVVSAIRNLGIPAVILDRDIDSGCDAVLFDHSRAVRAAMARLLALGHRDIALVVSVHPSRPMRRRVETFRAVMREQGLGGRDDRVIRLPTSVSNAYGAVREMLASSDRPTAIISLGTSVLADVLHAVSASGLRTPDDVSVVSLGDPDFIRSHDPTISALAVDLDFAAQHACALLLRRMRGDLTSMPERVMVPITFIERASCASATT